MTHKTVSIPLVLILFLAAGSSCWSQESPLQISTQADSLRCHSDDDGELNWEINGGEAPYSYEWRRLGSSFVFSGGTQMVSGPGGPIGGSLEAGTYVLTVEDNSGAIVSDTIEIGEPERILVLGIDLSDASCAESCDGWIDLTVGGGTGALSTNWNDSGEVGTRRENLCGGDYVFFITDERGCRQKGSIPIGAPPLIEVTFNNTSPSCAGASNGSILAEASGGVGELEYQWSAGSDAPALENLSSSDYQLSISDEAGCIAEFSTFLEDGPPLAANLQVNYGCGDGNLIVSTLPINGMAPYTYQWSNGSSSSLLFQMSAGQYGLSLTDANGCVDVLDFELDFVAPLMVNAQVQDVTCPGAADGSIQLNVSGGLPPYQLLWDGDLNGLQPADLEGGTYGYNINAGGCGLAGNIQVDEPQALQMNLNYSPQSDGLLTATAFISGGTFPYLYQWSNGSAGMMANNLELDQVYTLQVTDANGCQEEWDIRPSTTHGNDLKAPAAVNIYPNPSSGVFWISAQETSTYYLYDLQGQLLNSGSWSNATPYPIDLTEYPIGTYQLQVILASGSYSSTLIKN